MDSYTIEALGRIMAAGQIAAAMAVLTGLFTAIGQGNVASKAIEAIARQPEATGNIRTTMFIGLAFSETASIYGLVLAILILFVNPIGSQFINLFS